ncbi:oligosaccharide flippase family protein [bacterium]|nr:oligosaccharide flippase family protein [bacterium]
MMVLKNSLIYLTSSVISKGAPFLLLPFLTSHLEPTEFGVLAIFLVMNGFYGAFIGMAMHANITKNFFHRTRPELAIITGNVFFILLLTTGLYLTFTLLIHFFFDSIFSIPSEYLLILPVLAFFAMANQVYLTVLRNEGRAIIYGAFEITNALFTVGVTLIFLIYLDFGWLSQVVGMLWATILSSVIGVAYLFKRGYLSFVFNKQEVLNILRLSIPLIPHVLGGVVIAVSDRLFIERMLGLEAVALYALGYSFGAVVSLFTDGLIKAWSPWFYKQLVEPTYQRKLQIVKSTYAYLFGIFIIAYFISVLGEYILPFVVETRYIDAAQYIWWIALGYAVHGVYKIFFPYLVYVSKTGFLAYSTVMAAIINLVLNYLLIPEYGALGAAYATILSFAVSAVLVFEYQRRSFWMPWLFNPQKIDNN